MILKENHFLLKDNNGLLKAVDTRYALIKTKINQADYHIVSINNVENISGDNYDYGAKYRFIQNATKYRGILVAIGTEAECNLIKTQVIKRLDSNRKLQEKLKARRKVRRNLNESIGSKTVVMSNMKSYIKKCIQISENKSHMNSKLELLNSHINEMHRIILKNENKIFKLENSIEEMDKKISKFSSQAMFEPDAKRAKHSKIPSLDLDEGFQSKKELVNRIHMLRGRFQV